MPGGPPPQLPGEPERSVAPDAGALQLQLQLGAVLGEGTSGIVSPVKALDGGRYVAKQSKTSGPAAMASLANEIRLHRICSESCTDVVRYIFASQSGEEAVVLMEACDTILWEALTGGPDWVALAGATPAVADRRAWTLQLCRAVQHCHQHRVLHRDINPWNVFLVRGRFGPQGAAVRLGDFGLAAQLPEGVVGLSGVEEQHGASALDESALGSLYSAPELGGASYGLAADVFSLGMTLLALWVSADCDCNEDGVVQATEDAKAAGGQLQKFPALASAEPDQRDLIFAMVATSPDARPSAAHVRSRVEHPRQPTDSKVGDVAEIGATKQAMCCTVM